VTYLDQGRPGVGEEDRRVPNRSENPLKKGHKKYMRVIEVKKAHWEISMANRNSPQKGREIREMGGRIAGRLERSGEVDCAASGKALSRKNAVEQPMRNPTLHATYGFPPFSEKTRKGWGTQPP
jgi:hypothetical protein